MGRMTENPRYNVVSFRVADDELKFLAEKARKEGMSIGDYVRAAALKSKTEGIPFIQSK